MPKRILMAVFICGCIVSTRTRKKKTCQTSIFPYLLVPGGPVAGSF